MKFALSSQAVPDCDISTLFQKAREFGFGGIDLDPMEAFPTEAVRQAGLTANIQIACIAPSVTFTGQKNSDVNAASELRACMDKAMHLGCHRISFPDASRIQNQDPLLTISALADWLAPLADDAANRGLTLLIENCSFPTARPLWSLMERLDHSSVGICWNIANSIAAGESPAITVPTLNSRIRYVRANTAMGDAMIRLMGIGYDGWVSFAGNSADATQFLSLARQPAKP